MSPRYPVLPTPRPSHRHLRLMLLCVLLSLLLPQASAGPARAALEIRSGLLATTWMHALAAHGAGAVPLFTLFSDSGQHTQLLPASNDPALLARFRELNLQHVQVSGSERHVAGRLVFVVQDLTALPGQARLARHAPTVGSFRWIMLFCSFPDNPVQGAPASSVTAPIADGGQLQEFWHAKSYGQLDLRGSTWGGWYPMPQPQSHYMQDNFLNLNALLADCMRAGDNDIYYPTYQGVIFIFNTPVFGSAAFGGETVLPAEGGVERFSYAATHAYTSYGEWSYSPEVILHEMGHGFGLPHTTSGYYGSAYDNPFDIMGHNDGAGLIAYHRQLLGWLPESRVYTPAPGSVATIRLENIDQPGPEGYLAVRVPVPGSERFYTIEAQLILTQSQYRTPIGLVHEVDPARKEPAWIIDADKNGNTRDMGPRWTPGEAFTESILGLTVCFREMTASSLTLTVALGTPVSCPAIAPMFQLSGPSSYTTQGSRLVRLSFGIRNYGGPASPNLSITLPPEVTYTSASAHPGSVTSTDPLVLTFEELNAAMVGEATVEFRLSDALTEPRVLELPFDLRWSGGEQREIVRLLVNPSHVHYLPLIRCTMSMAYAC